MCVFHPDGRPRPGRIRSEAYVGLQPNLQKPTKQRHKTGKMDSDSLKE